MINKNTIFYCCFLAILLSSCVKDKEAINVNDCLSVQDKYTLEKKEKIISFELDSVTPPIVSYLKYVKLADSTYFTFLNSFNNKVYLYDYDSKKLIKTIQLVSDKKISAYEIISPDKIATYQKSTYTLNLQNEKEEIFNSIKVPLQEGHNGYYAFPNTHSSLISRFGKLYLVGGHLTDKKADLSSHSVVEIDSSFKKFNYLYHFPDIYKKYFFGGSHYRMGVTYIYNADEDKFVFNFPASHNLYSTTDFVNDEEFCASSKHVRSIEDYPYSNSDEKSFDYVSENAYYQSVLYDSYNKVYYRLCLLPVENKESDQYTRDLSVIILDKELNKIGERLLKNYSDYYLGNIESINVSPEGLLFQQKNEPENEDYINFILYKLIKL